MLSHQTSSITYVGSPRQHHRQTQLALPNLITTPAVQQFQDILEKQLLLPLPRFYIKIQRKP